MKKLLLSILVVLFAVPAFAVNIPVPVEGMKLDIYASIRMVGFYRGANADKALPAKSDFGYALQGNTRLGVNFAYENFFATVETNYKGDGENGLGFRQFFGGYKFSNGLTLTVGQKTTLTGFSGTIGDIYHTDNGLNGFGAVGDVRRPLVMLSFFGVDFAVVDPSRDSSLTGLKRTTNVPRFELAYNLKYTNLTGKVFASYSFNTYKNAATNADDKYNLNAFVVGAHAKPTFGKMFVNIGAFYAMNAGVYGSVKYMALGTVGPENLLPTFSSVKDKIEDVHTFGVAAEFGVAFTPTLAMNIGGGYQFNDSKAYTDSLNAYAAYIQLPWKMNKYMTLKPQVGYYAAFEDNRTAGMLLAGAQLRVDF